MNDEVTFPIMNMLNTLFPHTKACLSGIHFNNLIFLFWLWNWHFKNYLKTSFYWIIVFFIYCLNDGLHLKHVQTMEERREKVKKRWKKYGFVVLLYAAKYWVNCLHPVKIFMIGTKIKENEYFVRQVSQTVINAQKEKVVKEGPFKRDRTKCRSWIQMAKRKISKGWFYWGQLIFCLFCKCFWNRLKANTFSIQILCMAHKDTQNAIVFIAF